MTRRAAIAFGRGALLALFGAAALCGGTTRLHAADPAGGPNGVSAAHELVDRLDKLLGTRCVTPEAGRALSDLVASGALKPILGGEFTLVSGNVGANQIALEIRDQAQRSYVVTLALAGTLPGEPDGQGRNFDFALGPSPSPPNPRATAALLAIASLADGAIPDAALGRCTGSGESHADPRYPRALILASATAQLLVVAAAIVFGLRAVGARPEKGDSPSPRH